MYFVEDLGKIVMEQEAAAVQEVWKKISSPLPDGTMKVLRDSLAWGLRGYREAVGERREAVCSGNRSREQGRCKETEYFKGHLDPGGEL